MADATAGARFGRLVTAMVTPFGEGGRLDVDGAVTLARFLVEHGSEALVLSGSTGEAPVLSDAEKIELWRTVAEAVTVPVIAGSGTNDTAHSIELALKAELAGAAAVLVVTPYYNRPSQAGLAAHFSAVAQSTSLPVMLYDIPVRSGRKISHDTMLQLAGDVPNIVGVKDAAGDVAGTARLVAEAPAGFDVYCGDDALMLPMVAVGAVGLVSVASHWAGEEHRDLIGAYLAGDVRRALALNTALSPSHRYESTDDAPNPVPAKAMLRVLGLPAGECRLPMGPAPSGLEDRAKQVLADLDAWRARG
jgi:4-hydroxy-tetrahydrodipicolinate synthase